MVEDSGVVIVSQSCRTVGIQQIKLGDWTMCHVVGKFIEIRLEIIDHIFFAVYPLVERLVNNILSKVRNLQRGNAGSTVSKLSYLKASGNRLISS